MPLSYDAYWFMSSYFILILLTPILNNFIHKTNIKLILLYIGIFLWVFSILPTFFHMNWMRGINNIEIFLILYTIGAIINKYRLLLSMKLSTFFVVFTALLIILSEFLIKKMAINLPITFYTFSIEKTPIIILSVFCFLFFLTLKLRYTKLVKYISSSVFAVYLIHIGDLWPFFFRQCFNNEHLISSNFFSIWLFFSGLTIFLICILIDKIRIKFIANPLVSHFDPIISNLISSALLRIMK